MEITKIKLLRVLEILRETDEDHPYTANEIIAKLKLYGLDAERKAVLRDIAALQDYGYDIVLHSDNKRGYFMASREFEDWELKVLMDAAVGASFLTEENSRQLAEKLSALSSGSGRKTLRPLEVPSYIIGVARVKIYLTKRFLQKRDFWLFTQPAGDSDDGYRNLS